MTDIDILKLSLRAHHNSALRPKLSRSSQPSLVSYEWLVLQKVPVHVGHCKAAGAPAMPAMAALLVLLPAQCGIYAYATVSRP